MTDIDFAEDAALQTGTNEQLSTIAALAQRAKDLEDQVQQIEQALSERKAELQQVLRNELPDAMDSANLKEFKTRDGATISIKEVVSASIPNKYQQDAFQWLIAKGHGDLIKHEVTVRFNKEQANMVGPVVDMMKDQYGMEPVDKQRVHPQTLSAFCREQLAAGNELPVELLGLYVGRIAQIKA